MPTTQEEKALGSLSLDDLQTTVQQQEERYGPLMALDNAVDTDGTKYTLLTLDRSKSRPDKKHLAVLKQCVGNTAPPLIGYAVVCTGNCYVTGQLQMIAAYRTTP